MIARRSRPSPAELERVNRALEDAPLEEVLRWALHRFAPGRIALVSAFGPGSAVLIDALSRAGLALPVIFIDTLHHFPETLEHVERVRRRYRLDLRVFRPALPREEISDGPGPPLWEHDLERYHRITKVEPFERATRGLDAWLTGRRRDQSSSRADLPLVEGTERVRINPLAAWRRARVWEAILRGGLPYNPLHDRGYPSIGDAPLTTPTAAGEPERAGRWRGSGRTECGIHLHDPTPTP